MDDKTAIDALWGQYLSAYRIGDAEGCARVFTDDAELYSPFAPVAKGRDAIRALHADWTDGGAPDKTLSVLSWGASEGLAWCVAAYGEGTATGTGTSLSSLERQPDGGWLIRVCALSEDEPPLA